MSLQLKALCHLGFTVGDVEHFFDSWGALLGAEGRHQHTESAAGGILVEGEDPGELEVVVAFTRIAGLPVELIQTVRGRTTHSDWLTARGAGMHHLAFWVDDLPGQVKRAEDLGLRLVMAPASLHRAVVAADSALLGNALTRTDDDDLLAVPEIFAFFMNPRASDQFTLELLDAAFVDQYRGLNGDLPGYPE